MTESGFEAGPAEAGFPEVADDDSPERDRVPDPELPPLPSDSGYPGAGSVGTTVAEQLEGESLDAKLAREVPEPVEDPLRPRDPDEARGDYAEADQPAGQLVAPDLGGGSDREKDEVATELAGAYDESPEEQAMRVEPGPA